MSFYDEYGDMRELDEFYSALEEALQKNHVPPAGEEKESYHHSFPNFPNEFSDVNYDELPTLTDDELPF